MPDGPELDALIGVAQESPKIAGKQPLNGDLLEGAQKGALEGDVHERFMSVIGDVADFWPEAKAVIMVWGLDEVYRQLFHGAPFCDVLDGHGRFMSVGRGWLRHSSTWELCTILMVERGIDSPVVVRRLLGSITGMWMECGTCGG